MKYPNVLFLMLPTPSHYCAAIPIAKNIQSSGSSVTFAGSPSQEGLINSNNFNFYEFKYMPTFELRTLKGFAGRLLISLLKGNDKVDRFKEFKQHVFYANRMLSHLKPQVVFIDEHLSHYFPYIQSIVPNCYLINTKLPSGKSKRVPPFNSSYIPTNNIFGEIICEVIWISHLFTKRLTRLTTSVAFLGCPNEYFQRRYLHRSKSKIQFTDKTSMYDYDNIIDVPSIHLMSDMFEFSWRKPKANEINMHSWNHSDENLNDSLSEIILKNHSEKSIVYCGLGTMASSNLTQYSRFISRLIDALSQSKHHLLIISTGSVKLTSQCSTAASELPNHVYIFDQVPQRALLAHCSIMITHGGLNSIKECIDCCVPMLGIINHAHKHKDTLGNIARIVFHKIGLRCMVTDKPSVLLQRVDKLLSDLRFKKNILYLKDKIDNESKKNVFTLNGIGNTI